MVEVEGDHHVLQRRGAPGLANRGSANRFSRIPYPPFTPRDADHESVAQRILERHLSSPPIGEMVRRWSITRHQRPMSPSGLYTEVYGHGEPTLVFLPGLGGTTRYYASRLHGIDDRYRVVLVDLLGFGKSPKPWSRYSVARHLEALHAVLRPYGPFSLVGHSLGAQLAVAYAARYPDCVKNIAVIGMPYFGSQDKAYRYMRSGSVKGGFLFTNVVLTMAACILTRRLLGRALPYLIRHVPREVAEDLVTHTWRSSTSSLWEVVYRYDAAEDLKRLPAETAVLIIHGDQDVMAPVSAITRLVAYHPQWRLRVLPGVDHHPFLRDPRACLSLIRAMVDSGEPGHGHAGTCSVGPIDDRTGRRV